MKHSFSMILATALCAAASSFAESAFSLNPRYTDHMVLQRDRPVKISGTASPSTVVHGSFRGASAQTETNADGRWELEFPAGSAGGPFELVVDARTTIRLGDIMVGDVWFCSGQSNMECPVWHPKSFWGLPDGLAVAADGDPDIRFLRVPRGVAPDGPCDEQSGRASWHRGDDTAAVKEFSAVAWFFARELRRRVGKDVPIGLIGSYWGGTKIQPWISECGFAENGEEKDLAEIAEAQALRDEIGAAERKAVRERAVREAFETWLRDKYFGPFAKESAEALASWAKPDLDPDEASLWKKCEMGGGGGRLKVGVTWHRREFVLPEEWAGREVVVRVKTLDDCDETFLDGAEIGHTGIDTPMYWSVERVYRTVLQIAPGGRHVLAIRHQNHFQTGRIAGPVTIALADDETSAVALDGGEWAERVEFHVDPAVAGTRPQAPGAAEDLRTSHQAPATLFNAMVAPFVSMPVRGVIWYQGCSNSGDPVKYRDYQREIVEDWRRAWNDPDLVFIGTQLASFKKHQPSERLPDDFWKDDAPGDGIGYAPIRDSQTVLFDIPGCGLACAIDVGDHSDIHPSRKREVGERLASEAMRLSYGDSTALAGPRGVSAQVSGYGAAEGAADGSEDVATDGAVLVSISDSASALEFRGVESGVIGPERHLFALYREDGTGEWAEARLVDGGTIRVTAPGVQNPVRVEYAWSAYPVDPCVYRATDGLPLFPFSIYAQPRKGAAAHVGSAPRSRSHGSRQDRALP